MHLATIRLSDLPKDVTNWTVHIMTDQSEKLLEDSIQMFGVEVPIEVYRLDNGKYRIKSGCRRIRACRKLGMKTIRAYVYLKEDINPFYHFLFNSI